MNVVPDADEKSERLKIDADQASVLAIIAQGRAAGASWDDYVSMRSMLDGDALEVAALLFGVTPLEMSRPVIRTATEQLIEWAERQEKLATRRLPQAS